MEKESAVDFEAMKNYLRKIFNKPLSRLIFGSQLLALLFMLMANFFPNFLPMPLWQRFAIAGLIAFPYTLGIPLAETCFRAREGTLRWFVAEVFRDWKLMTALGIALFLCAFRSKAGLAPSLLTGILGGLIAPFHGAMCGSFFCRMIKRGLM